MIDSREKGKVNEREVCRIINGLLGFDAKRRVRNDHGDSDLIGVPGMDIEVKARKRLQPEIWWQQTVRQAKSMNVPVLFYKIPYRGWRVVYPLAMLLKVPAEDGWLDYEFTVESTPEAWAAAVREMQ